MMQSPDKCRRGKNQNDPARFIHKTSITSDGEIADKSVYELDEEFTWNQILETLRGMNMTLLSKESGYIPSYKRTKLTDSLHSTFGFRTDIEFISKASMRGIISKTKKGNSTKTKI